MILRQTFWKQRSLELLTWKLGVAYKGKALTVDFPCSILCGPAWSWPTVVQKTLHSEGKTNVYTKGVLSSENSSASTGKQKGFGVYQTDCCQGKRRTKTFTPKSLPSVCGGSLRAMFVYRFWPPIPLGSFETIFRKKSKIAFLAYFWLLVYFRLF